MSRILVLTHQTFELPTTLKGMSDKEIAPWKTEYDVVVALQDLGHDWRVLGGFDEVSEMRRVLFDWKPAIVFNLLEEFRGEGIYVPFILGYLQLVRQPFTGCDPSALIVADDKVLTKQILRYHRIPVPDFVRFRRGRVVKRPGRLTFPLIVKSASEHGSVGIAQASIVTTDEKLRERVDFVHDQIGTDAIAERYIDGRELYVAMIGNIRLQTFPVWELKFENLAQNAPRIATEKVKWDLDYQVKRGIVTEAATDLPSDVVDRMTRISKRVYRILGLTGYARMDFRLTGDGRVYLLEPNPNPDLSRDEDFALAAQAAGIEYEPLIQRIINLGLRYQRGQR